MLSRPRAATISFVAFLVAWSAVFAYLATIEPILHDGWWHALAHARRPFGLSSLADFIQDSYLHHNPRLGEWLTFVAFAPGPWHALLAAAGASGLLLGAFVLGYARAPRPRDLADTARLVAIAGLCYACLPNPGQMFCYRPFTGNYVWAFCATMALAAPYRLALARPATAARARAHVAAAIGMLVLGVAAGMANEHTGPVAICAVAGATILLRKRDGRFRAWTLAGLVGLAAGFALLLGAPGQSVRYHGLGAETSLLGNFLDRGAGGNLRIVGMSLLYTCGAWACIAFALVKTRRARGPGAGWRKDVALLAVAALAIVAVVLLSPKQGARLFVAPALLLIAAAVRAVDEAFECRIARAVVAGAGALLALGGTAQLVRIQRDAAADFEARVALLRAAPPGTVPAVPPYRHFAPQWWTFGDDFRSAPLREHVARRAFGADDVTLDTRDPHLLDQAGVSLALVIDPPGPADPLLARAADPDGDGFSDQLFTGVGVTAALDRFRGAVAAASAHGAPHRALLLVRGLAWPNAHLAPLAFASWDATGFHLPLASDAPAGSLLLRAGGAATPIRTATSIDALVAAAPPGGYFVATCDPDLCHVLAARRR